MTISSILLKRKHVIVVKGANAREVAISLAHSDLPLECKGIPIICLDPDMTLDQVSIEELERVLEALKKQRT